MVINRANIVNNIVRGGKEPAYAFVPYGMLESNGREDFREAGSYLVYEDEKGWLWQESSIAANYDFV